MCSTNLNSTCFFLLYSSPFIMSKRKPTLQLYNKYDWCDNLNKALLQKAGSNSEMFSKVHFSNIRGISNEILRWCLFFMPGSLQIYH